MKQHMSLIAGTCFYHLRRLRQIRRRAGYEVTMRLVLGLIMSKVDFSALFASLPASTIAPLQRVQNAAARLVLQLGRPRDHISQGLRELHWLPIRARVL